MQVRPYQSDDAPRLLALKRETIERINSRDYSTEQVQAWAPDDSALALWPRRLERRFVVVAEDGGQIVGFGDVGAEGHIDQFYVHADHQRRGVGRMLLNALIGEATRAGMPRLYSDVSITARPFFESHDFRVDAEQEVVVGGVQFTNYRMSRVMKPGR